MSDSTPVQRILIVEDSRTQATALSVLLEEHDYATVVAPSGERALELIEGAMFDLVMTDVVMPGIDGYEVCRRIKSMPGRGSVPVVLLTSLSDPLDIVRGLEAGADHYVTKPYDPTRLVGRVRHVLRRAAEPSPEPGQPVTVDLLGIPFTISATKEEILDLLVSSYGDLVSTSEAVRAAERRARFLAEAGERLSQSLDLDHVMRELVAIVVPALADLCAVTSVARGVVSPASASGPLATAGATASARVVETQRSELLDPTEVDGALAAAGVRSLIAVPLVARGSALGVLLLGTSTSARTFTTDDLELAEDVARRAALAVDNAMLYQAAQLATQARNDLLAIVSHDLRNPLHTIQMAASFLIEIAEDPTSQAPVKTQLAAIRRAATRGNALIQDLLDASRIEAGRLAVETMPIGAAMLVEDAVSEMAVLAAESSIALDGAWSGPPTRVAADRERIGQLFANLIGNAIKFTPTGGRVTVSGRIDGSEAAFSVSDTGPGIPEDQVPRLFDRFWQAKQASRAGAGLGLFIARGIVEAHGGQLAVESVVGSGTTFTFTLSVVSTPAAGPSADEPLDAALGAR
ncbi:MAG TPA: ATP-binding protein [Gemmatimonadaceae bacterium]|nr:ATP-binding protein [Gemmatimonadaceae bacterium]